MIHNGAELQLMEYNGVEVQTWVHNGVEMFTSSQAWTAIASNGTLTSPCAKPVAITSGGSVYFQGSNSGNTYQVAGQQGITTRNEDGTYYIPTNKCKYMRVRIFVLTGYADKFIVKGKKKDGTEETIGTYNTSGGTSITYGTYKDLVDIEVKVYESVRVYSESSTANQCGLGYLEFYN